MLDATVATPDVVSSCGTMSCVPFAWVIWLWLCICRLSKALMMHSWTCYKGSTDQQRSTIKQGNRRAIKVRRSIGRWAGIVSLWELDKAAPPEDRVAEQDPFSGDGTVLVVVVVIVLVLVLVAVVVNAVTHSLMLSACCRTWCWAADPFMIRHEHWAPVLLCSCVFNNVLLVFL